ncbi:MAG: hypothetical protein R3275_06540, partial [Saprospiraceae bacterium]|nr:hypothetical protein [Saprospiraceae bacterium]
FDRSFTFQEGGYDGYAFYSYAQSPFAVPMEYVDPKSGESYYHIDGVVQAKNYPFRKKRIGYPFVSWLVSGFGYIPLIPISLVIVNVLAFFFLMFLIKEIGKELNWPRKNILFPLLFVGAYICLARDLSDLLAMTFATGSIYYILRSRLWPAVILGVFALFTKESVVLLLAVPFAWYWWTDDKTRGSKVSTTLALAIPFVCYALWNIYLGVESAEIAGYRDPGANFSWPIFGMIQGFTNSESTISLLLAVLLTTGIYALALEAMLIATHKNFHWKWNITSMLAVLFILHFVVSLCFSYKIYEDFWSLGRNLLPLQVSSYLFIMTTTGRISRINTVFSLVVFAVFYIWMILIP